MKPFTKLASVIFGIVTLIHVYRLINPFQVMIGNNEIPVAASYGLIIIGLVLCIGLWKESNK